MEKKQRQNRDRDSSRGREEMTLLQQHEISIQAGIKTSNKVTPLAAGVSKPTNKMVIVTDMYYGTFSEWYGEIRKHCDEPLPLLSLMTRYT